MTTSSARGAQASRHFALASIAAALLALIAAVAFATAAPAQAYADDIAYVGYQDKTGSMYTERTVSSIAELNKAIVEYSSDNTNGAYVEFRHDVKLGANEQIVVPEGKKAYIALAGYAIDGSQCKAAGFACHNATLTIDGGSSDSAIATKHVGYIDQTNSVGKLWKMGTNASKEEVVIEGGLLTGFRYNAVVSATSDANITLNNLTIAGDTNSASVLINHWRCKLQLNNTTMKWNFSKQGGAIEVGSEDYIARNSITLNKSTISENVGYDGGGICVWRAFQTTLKVENGSRITNNYAAGGSEVESGNGGGIFFSTHSNKENWMRDDNAFSDTSSVSIAGGSEISGNIARTNGGGIMSKCSRGEGTSVRGKRVIVMDGASKISNNQAKNGGGVYLLYDERTDYPQYPYMDFQMRGASEISGNKAEEGGGIYILGSAWQQLTMNEKSHIDGNEATTKSGGGVFVDSRLTDISMIGGSTINNNKAAQSGGGIFDKERSFTLSMDDGSQINGNNAVGSEGGGICTNFAPNVKIEMFNDSQVSGNRAAVRGGGLSILGTGAASIAYDETSASYVDEELGVGVISYNAVTSTDKETRGGGIYTSAPLTLRNVEINHNSLDSSKSSGGGLFVDNTTATIINCSVTDNKTAGGNGGGIEVSSSGRATRATLGGKVVVRGNANGSGAASDVHIGEKSSNKNDVENDNNQLNNRINESSAVPLTSESRIGLQRWTGTDAAKHAVSVKGEKVAASESLFFSDDPTWSVSKINDAIWLVSSPSSYKLNVYAGGTTPALSEMRVCGSAVTVNSGGYMANGLKPDYWTVGGLGSTTKLTPDANGNVSFTMPGNDVTLTAHYPTYVTGITVDMNDTNDYSDTGSEIPVDVATVTFTDSAGQKKAVPVTATEASGSRSYLGDVVQNRLFTYTAVVNPSVAKDLGLSVVRGNIQTHVINVSHKDSAVQSANALDVTVLEDGSIKLTAQITVVKPETSTVSVTKKCANVNTKVVFASDNTTAAVGSNFSWDANILNVGWQFAEWQTPLPDGASADGSIVTVKGIASATEITAYYKPIVLSVNVVIPELSCGQAFPSTVTSYKVTDIAGERDITDVVNKDVKLTWTTLDGSPAGEAVKAGVEYRVSITTGKLAADGYQYGTFATMSNTSIGKCVTLNGATENVMCTNAEGAHTVTGQMSAHDSEDFDKIVTSFSKVSVSHALACEDEAAKTVSYQLKNGSVKTADITWDFSGVDDTMASGEFTIKGSFTDAAGAKHEVSQTFALMDLHAPVASPNDIVYEASQQVTLSLDSSFAGVKDADIWYCVTDSNTKPAASDYKLYTGAFTVEKGDYQVVHAYAKVGQRQTALAEFDYIFSDRHTVKVNGGKAVDGEGNVITSALEGSDVFIVADAAAAGKSFKAWTVAGDTATIEDPASAETSFYMGAFDVEVTATYSAATYTVSFDTQGGSTVAPQTVEHGATATAPTAPTRAGYAFKGWYADAACTQVFDFAKPITGDTTLYAKWAGLVTISFDSAGGSAVDNKVIDEGASLGGLPMPTREGYFFMGWYNGADRVTGSTTFAKSTTLTAHWQPMALTVRFLSGYQTLGSVLVDYGTPVSKPADPVKTGYLFEGWYTDSAFGTLYNFSDPVYCSLSLQAKWKANSYTVTFNANGGSSVAAQAVEHGATATKPADPVRAGYVFKGWYADAGFTTAFDFNKAITGNTTLYAKWAKLVTVTFNADGGTEVASQTLEQGSSLGQLPTSKRDDHVFAGWYLGDTRVGAWTIINEDVTLTAHWDQNVYCVQYYDSDGETCLDIDVVNEGEVLDAPKPSREGYSFVGWYTDKGLTEPYDFNTPVHSDFNLYAKWQIAYSDVNFVDGLDGTVIETRQVAYGDTVVEPDYPEREGYIFDGWYTDKAYTLEYNFDKMVTEPVTLYAKWAEKVTIIYKANDGTEDNDTRLIIPKGTVVDGFPDVQRTGYDFGGWYEGDLPAATSKAYEQDTTLTAHWVPKQMVVCFMDGENLYDIAVPDYDSKLERPADPVRTGYTFEGWYTDEDCTQAYNFADPVRADFDLHAKWSISTYTVSFAGEGVDIDPQTVVHGQTAKRPDVDPVRDGYAFKGWYADEACTIEYSFATPVVSDVTVYAKWAKVEPSPSDEGSDTPKGTTGPEGSKGAKQAASSSSKSSAATSDGTYVLAAGLAGVAVLALAGCGMAAWKRRKR